MNTTIVGTSYLAHFASNVAAARKGLLPPDIYMAAKERLGT